MPTTRGPPTRVGGTAFLIRRLRRSLTRQRRSDRARARRTALAPAPRLAAARARLEASLAHLPAPGAPLPRETAERSFAWPRALASLLLKTNSETAASRRAKRATRRLLRRSSIPSPHRVGNGTPLAFRNCTGRMY